MCGITAILTLAGASKVPQASSIPRKENQDPKSSVPNGASGKAENVKQYDLAQQVKESLKFITHRGPDYSGSWASDDGLIGTLPCEGSFLREIEG